MFAVSLTETANIEKLKAYTGSDKNLYLAEQSDKFIEVCISNAAHDDTSGSLTSFRKSAGPFSCVE